MTVELFMTDSSPEKLQQEAKYLMIDTDSNYIVSGMLVNGIVEGAVWLRLSQETMIGLQSILQEGGFEFLCKTEELPNKDFVVGIGQSAFDYIWPTLHKLTTAGMTPVESIQKMIQQRNQSAN